jgi:pSer/pThr/pTyr-binding forkhead associated (FHA) protein
VIECYDEVTILRDLGSANGTLLNRQVIREDFLKDQDEIQVGDTHLKFIRRGKDTQAPR